MVMSDVFDFTWLLGLFFWILAVGGTSAAVFFWIKKKKVPAILCTIAGAIGIFILICSFLLLNAID